MGTDRIGSSNTTPVSCSRTTRRIGSRRKGERGFKSEIHYPPERFALHLFGHMHEPSLDYTARGGSSARRRFQGCSLFGVEGWGEKNEQRSHGYSLGQLQFVRGKAELRIWPRRATKKQDGSRKIDRDESFDLPKGKDHTEPTPVAQRRTARGS